jgi:hypothetical protein
MSPAAILSAHSNPLGGTALSSWLLSGHLDVLIVPTTAIPRATARAAASAGTLHRGGNKLGDSLRDGHEYIVAEFTIFPRILLFQLELFVLAHIGPTQILDFLHDVQENLFWASIAWVVVFRFSDVSARDVCCSVDGERNAIRHLLVPAFGVYPGVIPYLLTRVDVNPSPLVF